MTINVVSFVGVRGSSRRIEVEKVGGGVSVCVRVGVGQAGFWGALK